MPLRKWHRTETRVEPRKKRGSIFTCARSEFVRYLLNRRLRRLERRERGVPNLQAQETEKDRDVREKTKPEHSGMAARLQNPKQRTRAKQLARGRKKPAKRRKSQQKMKGSKKGGRIEEKEPGLGRRGCNTSRIFVSHQEGGFPVGFEKNSELVPTS
jgi:hypothetical protein